jgi:hypothetical protein
MALLTFHPSFAIMSRIRELFLEMEAIEACAVRLESIAKAARERVGKIGMQDFAEHAHAKVMEERAAGMRTLALACQQAYRVHFARTSRTASSPVAQ